MEISPQRVRTADFSTAKKGFSPDEVRTFLAEVAAELERAQNQSTAMEARARAAVARLQELSESGATATGAGAADTTAEAADATPTTAPVGASVDESETISRTLLLAQRTADTTVAEAQADAARIRADAEAEATRTLDGTRETSAAMLDEAREEARRGGEAERLQVEGEVSALLARRDFLESDVDHLQSFLVDQRARLRDAAGDILDLVDKVPGGLGEVRRPLLSAADDDATADDGVDATHDATLDDTDEVTLDAAESDDVRIGSDAGDQLAMPTEGDEAPAPGS